MKRYFLSLVDFFQDHLTGILDAIQLILVIGFIFLCVILILLVLLQRGEEGAFSKNRGDKTTTNDKNMNKATIICSLSLFIIALILNGMIRYSKHHSEQNTTLTTISKQVEEKK